VQEFNGGDGGGGGDGGDGGGGGGGDGGVNAEHSAQGPEAEDRGEHDAEGESSAPKVENLEAETSDADGKVESGGHLV